MDSNTDKYTDKSLVLLIKTCLSILRYDGLNGEAAMKNLSYFLVLKLIEPHLEGELNMDEYFEDTPGGNPDYNSAKHYLKFSNLKLLDENNIKTCLKLLWDNILCEHPATMHIFPISHFFDISSAAVYVKIIDKLSAIDLTKTDTDILGSAYEEGIQDVTTSKVFQQYFTPKTLKDMMLGLINPRVFEDGRIETCGDPAMGSGGFLTSYIKNIMRQAKEGDTPLDWNFINNEGIWGREIDATTHNLAVSNMLITSGGHSFTELERGDSLREVIPRKFDIVMANPPFNLKGLTFGGYGLADNLTLHITSDNAVVLFLQVIIEMLKVGGRCAVCVPQGSILCSKTKRDVCSVRQHLMQTCDLKEVILVEGYCFSHTSIRTCVLFFEKHCDWCNSGPIRDQTVEVKFSSWDVEKNIKTLIVDVPISVISNNRYSLNHSEYINSVIIAPPRGLVMIYKPLGELGEFLKKTRHFASYGKAEGAYPFFTSSIYAPCKYVDTPDYEDECLIIGAGGQANIKYSKRFSCSDHNFIFKITSDLVRPLYVYYYLLNNLALLQRGFTGAALQHISCDFISKIAIPTPLLAKQDEMIRKYEVTLEKIKKAQEQLREQEAKWKDIWKI